MSKKGTASSKAPFWAVEEEPDTEDSGIASSEKKRMANSGISQDLMLLGRSLHLQTEATDGKLRTEVFDKGRVVATRDGQIDRDAGKNTQRLSIKSFHQKILAGILDRASRFQENRKEATETELSDRRKTDRRQTDPLPDSIREVRASSSPQPGSSPSQKLGSQLENEMAKVNLEPLAAIDGFVGTCLVDSDSGMMLGAHGGGVNLELAAAGNTQVVRAKRRTMESLSLNDNIEDILISLNKQYHLIRILESNPAVFLYVVLDRGRANLAMARLELKSFESTLKLG